MAERPDDFIQRKPCREFKGHSKTAISLNFQTTDQKILQFCQKCLKKYFAKV